MRHTHRQCTCTPCCLRVLTELSIKITPATMVTQTQECHPSSRGCHCSHDEYRSDAGRAELKPQGTSWSWWERSHPLLRWHWHGNTQAGQAISSQAAKNMFRDLGNSLTSACPSYSIWPHSLLNTRVINGTQMHWETVSHFSMSMY